MLFHLEAYIQVFAKPIHQNDEGPLLRLLARLFTFNPKGYVPQFHRWLQLLTRLRVQVCSFGQYQYGPPLSRSKVNFFIAILATSWLLVLRDLALLAVDDDQHLWLEVLGDYLRPFDSHRKLMQMALAAVYANSVFFTTINWTKMLRHKAHYIQYLLPFCVQQFQAGHEQGARLSAGLSLSMQRRFQFLLQLFIHIFYLSSVSLLFMFWSTNGWFVFSEHDVSPLLLLLRTFWLLVNGLSKTVSIFNGFWTAAVYFFSVTLQNCRLQLLHRLYAKVAAIPDQRLTWTRMTLLLNELHANIVRTQHLALSFNGMMGEAFYTVSLYNNVVLYYVLFVGQSFWINFLFAISGFPVFCMLFFLVSRACLINKKFDLMPKSIRLVINCLQSPYNIKFKMLVAMESCSENALVGFRPLNMYKFNYHYFFQLILGNVSFFILLRSLAIKEMYSR